MQTHTRQAWRLALLSGVLLAAIVAGATARQAVAQPLSILDHLKCYRIAFKKGQLQVDDHLLDPLTLTPFQVPPFAVEEGCRLQPAKSPRPTHVCIPVDKQPRQEPRGTPLSVDYLVYRMRCPEESDIATGFVDQFVRGIADVKRKATTRLLLVPAYPSATPTSPCQPTAPDQCGGECPFFDQSCQLAPDGTCGCVEQRPCGGSPVEGQCNGACEPGAMCLPDYSGECACLR